MYRQILLVYLSVNMNIHLEGWSARHRHRLGLLGAAGCGLAIGWQSKAMLRPFAHSLSQPLAASIVINTLINH